MVVGFRKTGSYRRRVKRLTDFFVDYSNDFSKQAEMINGVKDVVLKLGQDIIKEELESYDELLRRRKDLRKGWHIVKEDEITRTTSLGDITYGRTLFINKETCVRSYLADELLGFEVRFQQRELPMAAGAEEVIYSAEQMIQMENANRRRLGNMADSPTYSIPYPQIRKIAAIRHHICGL